MEKIIAAWGHRIRLGLLVALGLALGAQACKTAAATGRPERPRLTVVQMADSVGFVSSWGPVRDQRGEAVSRYLVALHDGATDTVVWQDSTTGLADTAWQLPPLPGTSYSRYARVAARDTRGLLGRWGSSEDTITITVPDTLGPPAPSVLLDTVLAAAIITDIDVDLTQDPPTMVVWSGAAAVLCVGPCLAPLAAVERFVVLEIRGTDTTRATRPVTDLADVFIPGGPPGPTVLRTLAIGS